MHYTIPKIKRELKLFTPCAVAGVDYTIPKIKRELKPETDKENGYYIIQNRNRN